MKIFIGIILIITNLVFSQNAPSNIGEANTLDNSLEYSSTIDLNRFDQFYVPITATAINDFSYMNISNGNSEKPPLSALRIGGELIAGSLMSLGAYHLNGLRFSFPRYLIGNALGIYIIGNIGNQNGSMLIALIGGLVGKLIADEINKNFIHSNKIKTNNILPDFSIYEMEVKVYLLAIPIIGTLFFNGSRKYDLKDRNSGLANIRIAKKSAHFGIPNFYIKQLQSLGITTIKMEVINVEL